MALDAFDIAAGQGDAFDVAALAPPRKGIISKAKEAVVGAGKELAGIGEFARSTVNMLATLPADAGNFMGAVADSVVQEDISKENFNRNIERRNAPLKTLRDFVNPEPVTNRGAAMGNVLNESLAAPGTIVDEYGQKGLNALGVPPNVSRQIAGGLSIAADVAPFILAERMIKAGKAPVREKVEPQYSGEAVTEPAIIAELNKAPVADAFTQAEVALKPETALKPVETPIIAPERLQAPVEALKPEAIAETAEKPVMQAESVTQAPTIKDTGDYLLLSDKTGQVGGVVTGDTLKINSSDLAAGVEKGQGVGKTLYNQLFDYAHDKGIKNITSDVTLETDAYNLWKSLEDKGLAERHPNAEQIEGGGWYVKGGDLKEPVFRLKEAPVDPVTVRAADMPEGKAIPAEMPPPFERLTPAGRRGATEAFTVNTSPSQLASLREVRQEVLDGVAGGRAGIYNTNAPGSTNVSWGSTFPEYFQNKGLTKKMVMPVIDRILKGESVTESQYLMVDDLVKAKRYDTLNLILNDRAEKASNRAVESDVEWTSRLKDAEDYFEQRGGFDEITEAFDGPVRGNEPGRASGVRETFVSDTGKTEAPRPETTSIKNAFTDAERLADGLPPIESPVGGTKSIPTMNAEGKALVDSGEFSRATLDSIIAKPRDFTPAENLATLYMKEQNRSARGTIDNRIAEARKSGTLEEVERLKAERDTLEMDRQTIDKAAKAAGTEWGRSGRVKQMEIAADYSLQRNIDRARAESPSGEITPEHRAEIESLTARLEAVMKEAETKGEQLANLEAEMALKTMRREEKAATRKSTRKATRETLDAEFADLTKELNKALGRPTNANPMLNPATAAILGKMAKNRVQKGMTRVADVVDSIHVSIEGALDKREIRDAISGYGKIAKMDNSPLAKQYREMKKKGRLISAVEDLMDGKDPLKSGLEMDKDVSPEVKVLLKQIDQMKKGVTPDIAPEIAAKDAFIAKTERQVATIQKALKQSIEEYTRKIQEKEFEAKKSQSSAPTTPEISELRKQRENLAEVYRAMKSEASGKATPEEIRIKSLEKAIAGYEQRIADGDISTAPRKEGVTSPKIEALKVRRDKFKAELDQMKRDAKPKVDPEATRLKSYKTRLNNKIAELEKQLETNDFSKKPRSPVQMDAEARKLKAREESLKREIDATVNPMTAGKKARAIFTEAWKAGLLSGPKTHIVNITSNALTVGLKPLENLLAGGLESVRSKVTGQPREVFAGEAKAGVIGLRAGVDEGFRRAARGWAEALPPEEMLKSNEAHQQNAIGGRTGKIVRLPFRALSAADGFFKGVAQSSEVYRLAYKQAAKEGLTGKELQNRMAEIIQEPSAKIIDASIKEADYRTFNSEFGPFGKWVASSRRIPYVGLVADILMPFIRTPINIAKYGLERSPMNYGRLIYKAFKGELKGGVLSEEMAKPVMGTLITAAVVNGVISGYITGGGPKDKADKEALYRTGWQPYSFKIGDKYYSYNRFEPIGMIVGSTADFADLAFGEEANVKTATDAANVVALSIAKNWTSKTFMQSLSAALDATSDPGRYGQQFISQYAGSLIPSIVNTATAVVDENRRDVKTTGDAMKNRIPGMSDTLEVKQDLWGRPLKKAGLSAIDRALSPVIISKVSNDPVDKEILRLGLSPGMPTRKIKGNELTPEQYSRYVKESGQKAYVNVARIAASGASDESKRRQITTSISKQRELTGNKLMREWNMQKTKKDWGASKTLKDFSVQ